MGRWGKFLARWLVAAGLIGAAAWSLCAVLQHVGYPANGPPPVGAVRVPSVEPVRFHLIPRESYSIGRTERP
jgi:hypothetical protein